MDSTSSPSSMPPMGPDAFSTDRARHVVAICAVFMFIATVAVILRFWSKRIKHNSPALDDWLIVVGLIFYYFSAIQTILQVRIGGLGHHVYEGVTPEELVITGKLGTYGQYAYALSMGAIRWSIISLFDRLFITKTFRRAALTVTIINILWIIFSILVVSLRCIPFSKNWNVQEKGHCAPQVPIVTVVAAWGLAIELAIWIMPLPISWRLNLPLSSKIALTVIFGLGIFDIGVGVGRLVTVLQVDTKDPTWTEVPALSWLAVEPSIAILVACLCVCRPLLEFMLPRRFRKLSGGTVNTATGTAPGGTVNGEKTFRNTPTPDDDRSKLVTNAAAPFTSTSTHAVANIHEDREKRNVEGQHSGTANPPTSRNESEDSIPMQEGIVRVRKDIIVSADERV